MKALITIVDDKPPIAVDDGLQLDDALRDAASEARARGKLGAILIEAAQFVGPGELPTCITWKEV